VSKESKGLLYGLLGIMAFSLTLPFTRIIIPYMDPIFIGLGRAGFASYVAIILLVLFRVPLPTRRQFLALIVVSLGVVIGFPLLSSLAMQTVPANHGGVMLGLLPLATAAVGSLIHKEKPSSGFWLSALIGSILVISYSLMQNNSYSGSYLKAGNFYLLGSIVAAAIGYTVGGGLSKQLGGWQVICWALAISAPFVSIPVFFLLPERTSSIPTIAWLSFAYLVLVSQLGGFFLWNKGLALGGIARVSQIQLVQPFLTILFSALLIGEEIETLSIIFALAIVLTVFINRRMSIKSD